MMPFPAAYPGVCGSCDQEIRKGQMVEFNFDDEVVHNSCPPPRKVCNRCFLQIPTGRTECPDCG